MNKELGTSFCNVENTTLTQILRVFYIRLWSHERLPRILAVAVRQLPELLPELFPKLLPDPSIGHEAVEGGDSE